MSTPVPSGVPGGTPTRRRTPGRWLAGIGLALWVLAAMAIVAGIARFDVGEFTDLVEDPASALETRFDSPGSTTVTLSSGRYWVFALGAGLTQPETSSGNGLRFTPPQLRVAGPEGPITVDTPEPDVSVNGSSGDLVLIYEFRAPEDGRYTMRSSGGSTDVTEIGIGDTGVLWDSAKGILGPAALILIGGLLGFLGAVLLFVAAILWITARSRQDTGGSHPVDAPGPFG